MTTDAEFEHRFTHPKVRRLEDGIALDQAKNYFDTYSMTGPVLSLAQHIQTAIDRTLVDYVKREDVKPLLIALAYYAEIMGTPPMNYDYGSTAKKALEQARLKGLLP